MPTKAAPRRKKPQAATKVGKPYSAEAFEPREAIGYLVTRIKTALWEEADRALAPLDLTLSQWIIIANLVHGPASTPGEICKNISYNAGAMTRLLDRLEKKGFIRRLRATADRRSVTLELTPSGRQAYPEIVTRLVGTYNDILEGFGVAEVRQLESLLKRLLSNLWARTDQPRGKGKTP